MSAHARDTLDVPTRGRGLYEITAELADRVRAAGIEHGLCHCFIRHTSASLIVTENADPAVLRDLNAFMERLVTDGDPLFEHDAEGPDDMAAHVRSVLTATELTVPIADGRLDLGTWQGVFVWEHRYAAQRRRVTMTLVS